jgi:hypothetical protein
MQEIRPTIAGSASAGHVQGLRRIERAKTERIAEYFKDLEEGLDSPDYRRLTTFVICLLRESLGGILHGTIR